MKMKENGCSADGITFSSIAQGLLRRGDYQDALRFLEEMTTKGFSMDSYTLSIIIDLVQVKEKNPNLLKIIQKFGPDGLRSKS